MQQDSNSMKEWLRQKKVLVQSPDLSYKIVRIEKTWNSLS